MQRFKNILLYTNAEPDEELALQRAADLALRNDARLTAMSVLEEVPPEVGDVVKNIDADKLQELLVNDRKKSLGQFVAPYRKKGLDLHIKVVVGLPFYELIRDALREQRDLVVKTAMGTGGCRESLFGSTAMHLLRKCPTPVWVVKPVSEPRYARMLAAVDPDPDDHVKSDLARTVIQLASSLARQEGAELHVLHTWQMPGEGLLRSSRVAVPHTEIDKAVLEVEAIHRKRLDRLLAEVDLDGVRCETHLPKGAPDKLIPTLARDLGAEVILMGTVGRTGLSGLFIGNSAEKVLNQVDASVLAVKPRGFISPVAR